MGQRQAVPVAPASPQTQVQAQAQAQDEAQVQAPAWTQVQAQAQAQDVIFPGDLIVGVDGVGDLDGDLNAMVLEFQRREYLMALVRADDA